LETHVPSAVDIEIDARDRGSVAFESCQRADVVLGDGDHGTS
jgi:hypothetical protein